MIVLYFIVYIVIALAAIALGAYLSYPGHTMLTLPGDVLSVLPGRSRPASILKDVDVALEHRALPTTTPVSGEEPSLAMKIAALGEAIKSSPTLSEIHNVFTPTSNEQQSEPEPAEAVHDEP